MQGREFKIEAEVLAIDKEALNQALSAWALVCDSVEAAKLKDGGSERFIPGEPEVSKVDGVAVMSIVGALSYRVDPALAYFYGLIDPAKIERGFTSLVNDPEVDTIVMDINSPGGGVTYIQELADTIYRARDKKRIIALANPLAASAAFWIASSAGEFYALPSANVGSVGVYIAHQEISKLLDRVGIKVNFISKGDKKVDGNPFEPLSDSAKETFQERVDDTYRDFTEALARNRAMPVDAIEAGFGQGSVVPAKVALQNGMIDGILTLDHLVDRELARVSDARRKEILLASAKNFLMLEELEDDA